MEYYFVYVKIDEKGRVIAINSSEFLEDTTGWTLVDEGVGDRYHHAQGNYLSMPIMTEDGVYRYKMVDGEILQRTEKEMVQDITADTSTPTLESRVGVLEEALDMILTGVTE